MKRDYISEIEILKVRSNPIYTKFLWDLRIGVLRRSYNLIVDNKMDRELLKYIPISIVACFESFFKAFIAELIDIGEPYNKNVGKLNQSREIKFDYDVVNAIQNKKLSVGEFIAHFLPCKRIDDINNNLSVLIDRDLFNDIKGFTARTLHEEEETLFSSFNNEADQIFKSISRTFELRHIFCHEFADNVIIDETEILQCLDHAELFLHQISRYLLHLTDPSFPRTQTDINIQSGENFVNSDLELKRIVNKIIELNCDDYAFDNSLFDEMLTHWRQFRESKALLNGLRGKGGSIYSCIVSGSKTSTTETLIEDLKRQFQII